MNTAMQVFNHNCLTTTQPDMLDSADTAHIQTHNIPGNHTKQTAWSTRRTATTGHSTSTTPALVPSKPLRSRIRYSVWKVHSAQSRLELLVKNLFTGSSGGTAERFVWEGEAGQTQGHSLGVALGRHKHLPSADWWEPTRSTNRFRKQPGEPVTSGSIRKKTIHISVPALRHSSGQRKPCPLQESSVYCFWPGWLGLKSVKWKLIY